MFSKESYYSQLGTDGLATHLRLWQDAKRRYDEARLGGETEQSRHMLVIQLGAELYDAGLDFYVQGCFPQGCDVRTRALAGRFSTCA